MKQTTRIICITLCVLLIALSAAGVIWALYSKFANNEAHAEELENTQTTFVNFNQILQFSTSSLTWKGLTISHNDYNITITGTSTFTSGDSNIYGFFSNFNVVEGKKYYFSSTSNYWQIFTYGQGSSSTELNKSIFTATSTGSANLTLRPFVQSHIANGNVLDDSFYVYIISLSDMFGIGNEPSIEQCQELFKADYYPYNEGTTIDLSGFEQYNAGAMSARESMTINTTSANVADNLDNVVINSSYGSNSKALIQGYMVWGSSDYANCTALFNLETNFNEGDYFEFEFYTITGADSSAGLPNISTFYDLQIIAIDSSGNIVPLTNVKAQNNPNATTKSTFYLPFSTDKLYITTPHKYIIGYNNFKINITTTNLTALSLYSYKDGYIEGRSSGYSSGYNAGIAQQNATLGTMGYIQSAFNGIGSILQIELLPNVPFSLFILLPLMFGLIAFVVKLSKGGS